MFKSEYDRRFGIVFFDPDELLDALLGDDTYGPGFGVGNGPLEAEPDEEELQRGGELVTRNGVAYQQLKDEYGKTVGWLNTSNNEVVTTLPIGSAGGGATQMQAGGAASVTEQNAVAAIERSGGTVTRRGDIIIGNFEDGGSVTYDPSDAGSRGILYNPTYTPPTKPSAGAPTIREVYDPATGTMRLKGYNPETGQLDIDFGQASAPPSDKKSLQLVTIGGRVKTYDPSTGTIVGDLGPSGTEQRPNLSKSWLTAREGDFNLTPEDMQEQLELAALAGFKTKGKTVFNEDTGEAWRFESQKMPTEGQGGLQDRFRLRATAGPADVFGTKATGGASQTPGGTPQTPEGGSINFAVAPKGAVPSPASPNTPGSNAAVGMGTSAAPPAFVNSAMQQNPDWMQFASLNAQGMPTVDQDAYARRKPVTFAASGADLMLDEPTLATFTGMNTGRQANVFAAEQPGMKEAVSFVPAGNAQPPIVDYRTLVKAATEQGFATKKKASGYGKSSGGNRPVESLLSPRGRHALAVLTG